MRSVAAVLLASLLALPVPAAAVTPGERLADPALEARARDLSRELRCQVCQNQSIDDSNAPLAADLRRVVRERLVAGDNDAAVLDYVAKRYGDYALLKPPVRPETYLLWFGPAVAIALAALALLGAARRRRNVASEPPLTAAEEHRLATLARPDERA